VGEVIRFVWEAKRWHGAVTDSNGVATADMALALLPIKASEYEAAFDGTDRWRQAGTGRCSSLCRESWEVRSALHARWPHPWLQDAEYGFLGADMGLKVEPGRLPVPTGEDDRLRRERRFPRHDLDHPSASRSEQPDYGTLFAPRIAPQPRPL
jgi:hypothetical protein